MLSKDITVKYICSECGEDYIVSIVLQKGPVYIFDALDKADKNKKCYLCCGRMDIADVTMDTIKDIFGNEKHGSWVCPNHKKDPYYPIPLRKSVDDMNSNINAVELDYCIVARAGFPWKCATCKTELKYELDNEVGTVVC